MFRKIKDWLGIEGVKLQIEMNDEIDLDSCSILGKIHIASKTRQYIQFIDLTLKEKYSRGRRKGKLVDEYVMGKKRITIDEEIDAEENKEYNFSMRFQYNPSAMDQFSSKNPFFRGIGGIAKWIKGARSEFYLTAEAGVKGNALKPYDTRQLTPL